jgi:hypothetical protein
MIRTYGTYVKNLLLIGVGPVVGAVLLFWLLLRSVVDLNDPEASYSGTAWFGVGPPLVIGVFIFAVGVLFMLFWRRQRDRAPARRPLLARAPGCGARSGDGRPGSR